jgi:phenylpropionate dioxygenase-like ring-hydroxylating dioxygenase large terminal subunit
MSTVAGAYAAHWADAMRSKEGFGAEQAKIGQVWQLVGLASDLANDRDWFRSTLGGRSIFVQRFKKELRGFENVCVHRGYPLRTEARGSGPIRCGFHHWQYNEEGLAVGIPKCKEMFGVQPRELDARLRPIEIALCGTLVFARFPSETHRDSLEQYLGPGFDILKSIWSGDRPGRRSTIDVKANWRLAHHISLDDYHIVAVHPTTFGKNGYMPQEVVNYYRFGRHSAFFYNCDERALAKMAEDCRNANLEVDGYRILQFFPNLLLSMMRERSMVFFGLLQFVPIAHDRTEIRTLLQEPRMLPGARMPTARRLALPLLRGIQERSVKRILQEDNAVCEQMQTIIDQLDQPQMLGSQEQRIGWFEENYREVVGNLRSAPAPRVTELAWMQDVTTGCSL